MLKLKAQDVADFFIWLANDTGSFVSNLKLQKLLYYSQGWYLGIYGEPLFDEDFQAWIHGPVIPEIYAEFKKFKWKPIDKNIPAEPSFSQEIMDFLDEIVDVYFSLDAYELEKMTHAEDPWLKARGNLPIDESCKVVISKQSMTNYFKDRAEEENSETSA